MAVAPVTSVLQGRWGAGGQGSPRDSRASQSRQNSEPSKRLSKRSCV